MSEQEKKQRSSLWFLPLEILLFFSIVDFVISYRVHWDEVGSSAARAVADSFELYVERSRIMSSYA